MFFVGRSNAINIAERLGMPEKVLDKARKQYGAASAEINEVTSTGLPKFYLLWRLLKNMIFILNSNLKSLSF